MRAHSSASEGGLASLRGWPGAGRGPGLPVHPGPALHPLTLHHCLHRGSGWAGGPSAAVCPIPARPCPLPQALPARPAHVYGWQMQGDRRGIAWHRTLCPPITAATPSLCSPHPSSTSPVPLLHAWLCPDPLACPRYPQLLCPHPIPRPCWLGHTDPSFPPTRSCSAAPWLRVSSVAPRTSSRRRAPLSSWRSGGSAWSGRSARMSSKPPGSEPDRPPQGASHGVGGTARQPWGGGHSQAAMG